MANFGDLTADGQSDEFTVRGPRGVHVHFAGGFGGGTVKVELKRMDASGTFDDLINATGFTTAQDKLLDLPHGSIIRLDISGSTTPTLFWQFRGQANV